MTEIRSAMAVAVAQEQTDNRTPLLSTPPISHSHPSDAGPDNVEAAASDEVSETSRSVVGVIGVLLIGVFIANADGSLVLATYGQISSEFNSLDGASWLVTSYILSMAASQPLYGKLSDIFGRTILIVVAYSMFAVGCVICGVAPSLPILLVGRVVSGIGGAGMGSMVSIMLTDLVLLRDIAPWRSYVNVVATVGRGLGGPIGGYLADSIGWRWSFLGQFPPTLLAIVLTWLLVPNQPHAADGLTAREKIGSVDVQGAILMAGTIVSLLLPLEIAGTNLPWSHPLILGSFGLTLVLGTLFVLTETRWASEPIFPLHVIRSRNVILSNVIAFFQTAAQLGMMYTVPLFFQLTESSSLTVAGAHLIPAVAGSAVGGIIGGHIIKRTGKYKYILIVATIVSSACYLTLALLWNGQINFWESLHIIPGGVGNGLVQSASFIALTASIEKQDMAVAASSFYLSNNTGTVVGMAATSAVLQGVLRQTLKIKLDGYPNKSSIIDQSLSDIAYIQDLHGELQTIVVGAYMKGLEYTHGVNLVSAVVALIASLLLNEWKL